jgi:hypothetical protein
MTALLAVGAMLAGCWQSNEAPKQVAPQAASVQLAQEKICVTSEVRVESGCEPGQRVVFMPHSWGNEQMPVMFAAMNCDLRYSVVMNNGGVTCVFLKARQPDKPESAASRPASGANLGQ